jgi:hypothetical protein
LNNAEILTRAVPLNDVRGQGGLGLLHFIYRRSSGLLAPWTGQSRLLFLYIIIQERKIIDIIHFLVKSPYTVLVSEKRALSVICCDQIKDKSFSIEGGH